MTGLDAPPETTAAWFDDQPVDERPRRPRTLTVADLRDAGIAAVAAAAVAGMLREVLAWRGLMSTAVWAYVVFVAVWYLLQRDSHASEAAADRIATLLLWSVGVAVVAALGWMLVYLVVRGVKDLGLSFFTQDMSKVGPLTPGGGAKAAIIGSVEQVGLATLVAVPLAVLTAIHLNERRGRLARPVRFFVDALSGKPPILFGLIVVAVWIIGHPNRFSGAASAVALLLLMLPWVTGTAEEVLRTVPGSLREASLALGAPQWRTVLQVVVPTARTGLITAAMLGIARAVGEAAPVLLTAGYTSRTNWNPFSGPQADLPSLIYNLVFVPNQRQIDRGWTATLVLVVLVLLFFAGARIAGNSSFRRRRTSAK